MPAPDLPDPAGQAETERLADRPCVPCRGGVPPLGPERVAQLAREIAGWRVVEGRRLARTFRTKDFATALELVNRIGAVAEAAGHHPDLHLSWGKVGVEMWTHKIGGLTESDFILAAKIDDLVARNPGLVRSAEGAGGRP